MKTTYLLLNNVCRIFVITYLPTSLKGNDFYPEGTIYAEHMPHALPEAFTYVGTSLKRCL